VFEDEPEDDGLGFLEPYELPDDDLAAGFPGAPPHDEEWDG
jgi:hypothetical protein